MKAHWLAVAKVLTEDAQRNGVKTFPVRARIPAELMKAARKFIRTQSNVRHTVRKQVKFDVDLETGVSAMMETARDKGLAAAASSMVTNAHRKYVSNARKVSGR